MNLPVQLLEFFRRHGLEHTTGIVAVSGGPDSVALTSLLIELLRAGHFSQLFLAHVNHQLRGADSDADEALVLQLPEILQMKNAPRLGVRTQALDVAAIAREQKDNLESSARQERYRWFAELAHEEKAAWVATGHSADDQAETVLFRLLRGSGILGLGAMHPSRKLADEVLLLRPLLHVRRYALLDYLHAHQIPYRLDASNQETHLTRNRIRHELLPHLREVYNPAIEELLCRLAQQAVDLHEDISQIATQLLAEAELPAAGSCRVFAVERLQAVSANLTREMFRLVWQRENWPMGAMDYKHWNRLVELAHGPATAWSLPGNIQARRTGGIIQIHRSTLDEGKKNP